MRSDAQGVRSKHSVASPLSESGRRSPARRRDDAARRAPARAVARATNPRRPTARGTAGTPTPPTSRSFTRSKSCPRQRKERTYSGHEGSACPIGDIVFGSSTAYAASAACGSPSASYTCARAIHRGRPMDECDGAHRIRRREALREACRLRRVACVERLERIQLGVRRLRAAPFPEQRERARVVRGEIRDVQRGHRLAPVVRRRGGGGQSLEATRWKRRTDPASCRAGTPAARRTPMGQSRASGSSLSPIPDRRGQRAIGQCRERIHVDEASRGPRRSTLRRRGTPSDCSTPSTSRPRSSAVRSASRNERSPARGSTRASA